MTDSNEPLSASAQVTPDELHANMYSDVDFPLDVPEPPPLERFSIEHWLYLAARGTVPEPPPMLAPFPLQRRSGAQLSADLVRWQLATENAQPAPDLEDLLHSLTTGHTHAAWGSARFPQRSHQRTYDLDDQLRQWINVPEQTIVPRVPFLITWSPKGECIAATSTEDGLTVAIQPATTDPVSDMAARLWEILDPEGNWKPRAMNTVQFPRELIDDLAAGESTGTLATTDPAQRLKDIEKAVSRHPSGQQAVDQINTLLSAPPAVIVQVLARVSQPDGTFYTPKRSALSLSFMADDIGGVVACHSPRDGYGGRTVVYEPGTRNAVLNGLKSVFEDARKRTDEGMESFDPRADTSSPKCARSRRL